MRHKNIIKYFIIINTLILYALFSNNLHAEEPSMHFDYQGNGGNCIGCEWVVANGIITKDTAKKFEKFMEEINYTPMVYLNSNGGNLLGGIELGRAFRKHKVETSIGSSKQTKGSPFHELTDGKCISACAYAFLGGSVRYVSDDSLGFHQFYDKRGLSNLDAKIFNAKDLYFDQLLTGIVVTYIREMGINSDLYSFTANVPPTDVKYLNTKDAILWKVDNGDLSFTNWELEAYRNGLVAKYRNGYGDREFRLFCRANEHFLAFILYGDKEYADYFRGQLEQYELGIEPLDKEDGLWITPKTWSINSSKNGDKFSVLFSFSKKELLELLQRKSIRFVEFGKRNWSRIQWMLFDRLTSKPTGDQRLPKIALENCV